MAILYWVGGALAFCYGTVYLAQYLGRRSAAYPTPDEATDD